MNRKTKAVVLSALALSAGSVMAEVINGVNINFVNIGNAGNGADTTGYGNVGYSYRISQSEITIDQFVASGVGSGNENFWSGLGAGAPASKVSWHEAARYANWLTSGNANNGAYSIASGLVTAVDRAAAVGTYGTVYVLPTENEWYKAAYYTGSGYTLFANGTGTAPVSGVDANWSTASAWTVGSGTVEQNGTDDLMGNVWEWTESAFDGNLDNIGEDIAFRGGSYLHNVDWLKSTSRSSDTPTLEHEVVGLRIVAIPEPGTISLMSLSTLSLFFTRTMRRRKLAGKSLLPIGREYACDAFSEVETVVVEESDYWVELRAELKAWLVSVGHHLHANYTSMQKMFWNRMVVVHDHKVERRTAFREDLKKKSLNRLDAFLARIMK